MAGNDWMNERKSSKSSSLFGGKSSIDYEAVNPNEAISGTAATSMMQQIISKRKAMIKEAANIVAKRLKGETTCPGTVSLLTGFTGFTGSPELPNPVNPVNPVKATYVNSAV